MKKILLALDIGNVCVRIDRERCFSRMGVKVPPQEFLDLAEKYETGIIREEADFIRQAAEMLDNRFSADEVKENFNAILIEAVPGMAELAAEFEKMNVQAVFFSDISPTHLQRTRELFSAFDKISGGIFSFESGGLKPSDAMFDRFEKLYGVPDLYADDRADLIAAARKRQWNAEVFVSAEDLRKKLLSLS